MNTLSDSNISDLFKNGIPDPMKHITSIKNLIKDKQFEDKDKVMAEIQILEKLFSLNETCFPDDLNMSLDMDFDEDNFITNIKNLAQSQK